MKKFSFLALALAHFTLPVQAIKGPIVFENVSDFSSKRIFKADDFNLNDVLERLREEKIEFVTIDYIDIAGTLHTSTITAHHAQTALKDGFVDPENSERNIKPDSSSFMIMPWTEKKDKTAHVIASLTYHDGTPHPSCTRTILKNAHTLTQDLGYRCDVAPTLQCFLVTEKDGKLAFVDNEQFCSSALKILEKFETKPEKVSKTSSGQYTFSFQRNRVLEAADNLVRARIALTHLANEGGYAITFMPKPFSDHGGSSLHVSMSLYDLAGQKNLFYSNDDPSYLSHSARSFAWGVAEHYREFMAIQCPTINSYKKFSPHALCDVSLPAIAPGDDRSACVKVCTPDSLCNPYAVFAALLHSGLDGMDRMKHSDIENISLPTSLHDAYTFLDASSFARRVLGEYFITAYCEIKRCEVQEFASTVTQWERDKYL